LDNGRFELPIREIHVRRFRPGSNLPRVLDVALYGVPLDTRLPWIAPLRAPLERLGYASSLADIHLEGERSVSPQESWDLNAVIKVAGAGNAALSLRLDKVNAEGVALALANPYNWLMVLPAAELHEGRFSYDDQGLVERIVIDQAKKRELTPETVRSEWLIDIRKRAQREKTPRVQAFWNAIADFCQSPGEIVFHTVLTDPVPLGRLLWMRQPKDIILGLSVDSQTRPHPAAGLDRLAR
jgi:hypothetical protein